MSTVLPMSHPALTVDEAAEQLDVATKTIRRWLDDGELTAVRRQPIILLDPADVDSKGDQLAAEYRSKLEHLTGTIWQPVPVEAVAVNGS
jgi:excisionase family DNA binding protein